MATQYAVLQRIKLKIHEIPMDRPSVFELRDAIENMENSIPPTAESAGRGWKMNSEAKKSEYLKIEPITLATLADMNYSLKAALNDYCMADYIYDQNIINAYYYRNIVDSINAGNSSTPSFVLEKYHLKKPLFKLFPGFGMQMY